MYCSCSQYFKMFGLGRWTYGYGGLVHFMTYVWIFAGIIMTSVAQNSPPTHFYQVPVSMETEAIGSTKVFLCKANGSPRPRYRWERDGTVIDHETSSNLVLKSLNKTHVGYYQCVASNSYGALRSQKAYLQVAFLEDFSVKTDKTLDVREGDAVVIPLPSIKGAPRPPIEWNEGTREIYGTKERYYKSLANSLVILELKSSDSNKYFTATAIDTFNGYRKTSPKFTLNVLRGTRNPSSTIMPQFVIRPKNTTAKNGDSYAALECVVNARPLSQIKIEWYVIQSGVRRKITADSKRKKIEDFNRKLTILQPQQSDNAIYECVSSLDMAGLPYTPIIAKANFTVLVPPGPTGLPPVEISKDYGETVKITCPVTGSPKPGLHWFKNAAPLSVGVGTRYKQLTDGSIELSSVTPNDSGVYQCFAKNQVGETNLVTKLVVISAPPQIVKKPSDQAVIAGADVTFMCEASGAPKPTIQWKKRTQFETKVLKTEGRFQISDKSLLIRTVEVTDSADYECIAENNKGTASAKANLKVAIRTVIIRPPQNVDVIKGSVATMKCGVQHSLDVTIKVEWFLDGRLVNDPRLVVQSDYTLRITSVRSADIGMYTCKVTSPAGNDSKSAQLKVVELPHRPAITSVSLSPSSDRKVDIQWSRPFDGNSPIKHFIIQKRLIPPGSTGSSMGKEGWGLVNNRVDKALTSYTVDQLVPAKTYQFRVSAVNSVGEGRASIPSSPITLPQQPPSGPPIGVVGSPRSNSSIIVQWQPPNVEHWNGILRGYLIRHKPSRYPVVTYVIVNVTDSNIGMKTLKNLIVFLEYEVEIAAYNDKGVGVYSNGITVRTKEGHPTAPPHGVTATALNSTSIKVTFLPPNPQKINGINQGYKIRARLPNKATVVETIIPPDPAKMQSQQVGFLHGLKKYTKYSIRVLCYTGAGEGPTSTPIDVRTKEDVPDNVENMRFDDVYDTSIKVLWNPPKNVNGVLRGYTLIYGRKNQTAGQTQRDLQPGTLSFTIRGLRAQTVYTISLYARTTVGNGAARNLDIKSGEKPELPGAPIKLTVSYVGARSVIIHFVPGSTGKTTIILWEIEAQLGSDKTWREVDKQRAPNARELTVRNLIPFTYYRLRMRAVNIVGKSPASAPSTLFQTQQAFPSVSPGNVTVRAVNETSIRVRWTPLPVQDWNGESKGYLISYRATKFNKTFTEVKLENKNGNGYILTGLHEWTTYEVKIRAYNIIGSGPFTTVKSVKTRESVPSAGPKTVNATAESSTTISITWDDVPLVHQNGQIVGFKILYGSQEIGLPVQKVVVKGGYHRSWRLTGLRKFVMYEIQVQASTRIGDGVPGPRLPVAEKTFEATPGPPSHIFFPLVTYSTVKVIWSPPLEPNGKITGYSVAYYEEGHSMTAATIDSTLGPHRREYSVAGLKEQTLYHFSLKAKTSKGWGESASLNVKTILNRLVPEAPHRPYIGVAGAAARVITLRWQAGFDGYSPIRNYTIEYSTDSGKTWTLYPTTVVLRDGGDFISYEVTGLKPFTKFMFRVAANNDIGRGPFSTPSAERETLQDKPDAPPYDLQVVPITTTSVKVSWKAQAQAHENLADTACFNVTSALTWDHIRASCIGPPARKTWNGNLQGFKLQYRQVGNPDFQVRATTSTEVTLNNLNKGFNYEMKISAYNGVGSGPSSPPVTVYVGEAIPAAPPSKVKNGIVTSTDAVISWAPPSKDKQNGDLLGYKVYYGIVPNIKRVKRATQPLRDVKMLAVTSSENQARLTNLKKYTKYNIMVSAFNPAGDGPNSTAITLTTAEDVPGPPGRLTFSEILMTSVTVQWIPPAEPNGLITHFLVTYQPSKAVSGVSTIVSAQVPGDTHYHMATHLKENISYLFTVKARTKVGWGPQSNGSITTGPQYLSPKPPTRPIITVHSTSIELKWKNTQAGGSAITGYLVQARLDNGTWDTIIRLNTPEPAAIVSFSNLKLKTDYRFRVIAMNKHGISSPSEDSLPYTTPAYDSKPFYQQFWFLIIVALTAVIFIIVIIAVFLVLGRNKKKRDKKKGLSTAPSIDDGGFATFELRQSQRLPPPPPKLNGTLGRSKNNFYKSGPKLGPASIYSDDDSIAKPPIPSDSSSCTEKPSDLDSVTETQASDSEPESEKPLGAHGGSRFMNPYVGDSIRKSWKEQHPSKAYSYTDSEPESYTLSLSNGGQHLHMNNMAGSRAPLPGFSSFV